jgi:hypothetical protein
VQQDPYNTVQYSTAQHSTALYWITHSSRFCFLAVSYCIANRLASVWSRSQSPSSGQPCLHSPYSAPLVQQKALLSSPLLSANLRPGSVRRYATLPPQHTFPRPSRPLKGQNRDRAFFFFLFFYNANPGTQATSTLLPCFLHRRLSIPHIGIYGRIDDTVKTRRHCIDFVFLVTATSHSSTRRLHVSAAGLDERIDRTV